MPIITGSTGCIIYHTIQKQLPYRLLEWPFECTCESPAWQQVSGAIFQNATYQRSLYGTGSLIGNTQDPGTKGWQQERLHYQSNIHQRTLSFPSFQIWTSLGLKVLVPKGITCLPRDIAIVPLNYKL